MRDDRRHPGEEMSLKKRRPNYTMAKEESGREDGRNKRAGSDGIDQ